MDSFAFQHLPTSMRLTSYWVAGCWEDDWEEPETTVQTPLPLHSEHSYIVERRTKDRIAEDKRIKKLSLAGRPENAGEITPSLHWEKRATSLRRKPPSMPLGPPVPFTDE